MPFLTESSVVLSVLPVVAIAIWCVYRIVADILSDSNKVKKDTFLANKLNTASSVAVTSDDSAGNAPPDVQLKKEESAERHEKSPDSLPSHNTGVSKEETSSSAKDTSASSKKKDSDKKTASKEKTESISYFHKNIEPYPPFRKRDEIPKPSPAPYSILITVSDKINRPNPYSICICADKCDVLNDSTVGGETTNNKDNSSAMSTQDSSHVQALSSPPEEATLPTSESCNDMGEANAADGGKRMILDNKKIVIIGGATGQGAAAAREAAKLGASVVIISRRSPDEKYAASVIKDCKEVGTGVYKFIQADASKEEQIFPAIEEAAKLMGGITGLVCCAHSASVSPSDDVSIGEFQQDIENNLYATVLPCQAAFPYLKESRGAILTNCANAVSSYPIWLGPYTASKMAVIGWSRTIAREWAPYGIRVNVLECVTATESTTGHPSCDNPDYMKRSAKTLHMLLMDDPDGNPFDYAMDPIVSAYYTCFLLSDYAPWTTNQIIKIDGGCEAGAI